MRSSKSKKIDDYFLSPNTFNTNEGAEAYRKITDRVRKIKGQKKEAEINIWDFGEQYAKIVLSDFEFDPLPYSSPNFTDYY